MQSALYSWCSGHQDWSVTDAFLCPPSPSVPFSVASWPLGIKGGNVTSSRCLWVPQIGSAVPWEVLKSPHLEWHLARLEKGSTWFQPAPHLSKWYNSPQSIFSSGPKNALYKRYLSFSCFPLGQHTELKGGDIKHFLGPDQYMYFLTF